MRIKAPFYFVGQRITKNGLHCRLVTVLGSHCKQLAAFLIGRQNPIATYWEDGRKQIKKENGQ